MNLWIVMLLAGIVTFGTRLSFIWIFGQRQAPELVRRALRYVPPAVLAAIIFPEVLMHAGALDLHWSNTRLLAGVLAAGVAWRTRSALLTIAVGMAALWLLGWAGF